MSILLLLLLCLYAFDKPELLVHAQAATVKQTKALNVYENIQTIVNGVARDQSGAGVDEIDMDGTTDWYRRFFTTQSALEIETSLEAPNVPLGTQTVSNKTVSRFFCPSRSFAYTCLLEKQAFQSQVNGSLSRASHSLHTTRPQVTSRSSSSGWNFGQTSKLVKLWGGKIPFIGVEALMGFSMQFSFQYSFQDATTNAYTEQETTVQVGFHCLCFGCQKLIIRACLPSRSALTCSHPARNVWSSRQT